MVTGSVRGGVYLVYGGSRPGLIAIHAYFTRFGHMLVGTSWPTPTCQILIPDQVLGTHSTQARMVCEELDRPQGTCLEKVCADQGAGPGKPVLLLGGTGRSTALAS